MVELAVVSPVLIALAFMGAWVTEVVRARLVNQGVAHALVWQLAGRLPADADWERSQAQAEAAVSTPSPQVTGLTFFQVSLQREDGVLRFPPPAPGGTAVASAFLEQGTASLLRQWGSAPAGQLEAESQLRVTNPMPVPWRDTGRADGLSLASLSAKEVLWADDGHLDDGADVRPGAGCSSGCGPSRIWGSPARPRAPSSSFNCCRSSPIRCPVWREPSSRPAPIDRGRPAQPGAMASRAT